MNKIYALALFIILNIGCSDDDSNSHNQDHVINTATSGTWRISYFYGTDSDDTFNFTGYAFTFGESNVLTATKGGTTQTGTWRVTDSDSNGDSLDDLDFNITFTNPDEFEELSENWSILEHTSTKIKLSHVSGGNGGTDYLTFEKN